MTARDIDYGRPVCVFAVVPPSPSEFVVFRIVGEQEQGDTEAGELPMRHVSCGAMLEVIRRGGVFMRARVEPVERLVRPVWDWEGFSHVSPLGAVALVLAAVHVVLLVVLQSTHTTYWQPDDLWSDGWVVAAAVGLAATAIGGAVVALTATVRFGEHSVLMLVPTLLGAFWAFWLLAQLPGWLG